MSDIFLNVCCIGKRVRQNIIHVYVRAENEYNYYLNLNDVEN